MLVLPLRNNNNNKKKRLRVGPGSHVQVMAGSSRSFPANLALMIVGI